MSNLPKYKQAFKEDVGKWLVDNGAIFVTDHAIASNELSAPKLDFLVLQPFPFAIEIVDMKGTPFQFSGPYKRFLIQRVALAQEFGPYLPFVVVLVGVPNSRVMHANRLPTVERYNLPFVDAVLQIDQLPELFSLKFALKLDSMTQHVLSSGYPKSVELSNLEQFEQRWRNALSLSDLVERNDLPPETLAQHLHEWMVGIEPRPSRRQPESMVNQVSNVLRWPYFYHEMMKHLTKFVRDHLGGMVRNFRIPLREGDRSSQLPATLWVSNNSKQIAIRHLIVGSSTTTNSRALDLLAEAWILRSIKEIPSEHLVLVLTNRDPSGDNVQMNPGNKPLQRIEPFLDIPTINSFEVAGWRVFPWDFAQTRPLFLDYLARLAE